MQHSLPVLCSTHTQTHTLLHVRPPILSHPHSFSLTPHPSSFPPNSHFISIPLIMLPFTSLSNHLISLHVKTPQPPSTANPRWYSPSTSSIHLVDSPSRLRSALSLSSSLTVNPSNHFFHLHTEGWMDGGAGLMIDCSAVVKPTAESPLDMESPEIPCRQRCHKCSQSQFTVRPQNSQAYSNNVERVVTSSSEAQYGIDCDVEVVRFR